MPQLLVSVASQIEGLQDIGRRFYARGWSVGTSSNYSVVIDRDPLELLVTASGKHKEQLTSSDFVRVDRLGQSAPECHEKSSAETMLHCALAADPEVGCVLHTHSVWSTLLSDLYFDQRRLEITGYEMLKGLTGITTHEARVPIRIFDNTQDIPALAEQLLGLRESGEADLNHAFLLRGHGMYTWGRDLDSARRHVEILEFLFEVVGRKLSI